MHCLEEVEQDVRRLETAAIVIHAVEQIIIIFTTSPTLLPSLITLCKF